MRESGAGLAVAATFALLALRLPATSLEFALTASDARSRVLIGRNVARLARQGLQLSASAAVATRARRAVVLAHEPGALAIGAVIAQRQGRRALTAVSASRADLWFDSCLAAQIPGRAASIAPRPRLAFGLVAVTDYP
eukprot:scaffold19666_cov65-Phaeocystis_antarctica.AAC.7